MKRLTLTRLLSRLKQLRQAHELTQEAFSEIAGLGYKHYQQIEAGRKPDLRLSTLERLAQAYGIEVYELLSPMLPNTRLKTTRGGSKPQSTKAVSRRTR